MTKQHYGRILRLSEVMERTGVAHSSIYLWIQEGRFPRQVSLGEKAVGWLESEIDAWVQSKIDQRDAA